MGLLFCNGNIVVLLFCMMTMDVQVVEENKAEETTIKQVDNKVVLEVVEEQATHEENRAEEAPIQQVDDSVVLEVAEEQVTHEENITAETPVKQVDDKIVLDAVEEQAAPEENVVEVVEEQATHEENSAEETSIKQVDDTTVVEVFEKQATHEKNKVAKKADDKHVVEKAVSEELQDISEKLVFEKAVVKSKFELDFDAEILETNENEIEKPSKKVSVVSSTVLSTSPGGTKSLKVGLKETKVQSENMWDIYDDEDDIKSSPKLVDWKMHSEEETLNFYDHHMDEQDEHDDHDEEQQVRNPIIEQNYSNLDTEDLRLIIQSRDEQINSLHDQLLKAVRGDASIIGQLDGIDVDMRDAKIVSLAKKVRHLTLALEHEKSKYSKLSKEKSVNSHKKVVKHHVEKPACSPQKPNQIDILKGKVEELQERADSMRRRLEHSKTEVKRLKFVLQKEIGDNAELDRILGDLSVATSEDSTAWKGRAEKIVLLKSKLKRAHEQIDQLRSNTSEENHGSKNRVNVDKRAQEDIRHIEHERRQAMEKLADEYELMEDQLTESKRLSQSLRARAKVVEGENKRYKEQMTVLLSKTKNDDTLVDALRNENERIKRDLVRNREKIGRLEQDTTSTSAYEELHHHSSSQGAQLERQSQLISKMRSEMERIKRNASKKIVDNSQEQLDVQAYSVNNKLLQVENQRLGELIDLFKRKLEQSVLEKEHAITHCNRIERSKVELERQLGNIRQGGRKRQPPADQLSELRDRYALLAEEYRSFKSQNVEKLSQKEEEIKILRDMGVEVKSAYERAISEMKRQVQQTAAEAHSRLIQSDSRVDDVLVSQLATDNEYLRKELNGMHHRAAIPPRLSPVRSMSLMESPRYLNSKILR